MTRKLSLAVLLLTAWTALAQTAGQVFPLTNTRYGAVGASALLRTDGTSPFVFWKTLRDIRVTRVVSDQNRSGEVVFTEQSEFDAAWTGTHFLSVTTSPGVPQQRIMGRIVDAQGHPTGQPFVILEGARLPRIAAGHGAVLMVYDTTDNQTRSMLLTPQGQPAATAVTIAPTANTRFAVTATANGFTIATSNALDITATTLDTQGRVVAQSSVARPGNYLDVSIASRGPRSLVVWTDVDRIEAAIVESNGALSTPIVVDNASPEPLNPLVPAAASAVWNGNGWTVAYQAGSQSTRMRVAHLDSAAQTVISREETAGLRNPSLAVIGGKVTATWTPTALGHLEPAWLGALPLGPNAAYPVTFGAAEQHLEATATSTGGMLAVWLETIDRKVSLRAGVRTHTGQWSEHLLVANAPATSHVVAESDGRNFVVFASFDSLVTSEAIFLDDSGRPTGRRAALPRPVEAAAWSGSHYGLVDMNGDARLLSPDGTVSAAVDLGVDWTGWDIASHGNGYLVTGGRVECQFLLCFPSDARALRLDANLQRVGVELQFGPADSRPAGVVWTGAEYVVVWSTPTGVGVARVPHAIDQEGGSSHLTMNPEVGDIARISGGVAVLGVQPTVREVKYFTARGTLFRTVALGVPSSAEGASELVALFDDVLAYVSSRVLPEAPHNGVARVTMTVISAAGKTLPPAPVVTVRTVDDRFLIDWTRPTGIVNGYRLEYRIDDGSWIEYERWFAPTETNIALRVPSFGTTFQFRVRAFNDAGPGPYSNAGTPVGRKRRATR